MDNDFDSVSWQNDEAENEASRPSTAVSNEPGEPVYGANASGKRKASHGLNQAGPQADAVDLAGIGDGRLECIVDKPQKENDGTKDAFVSYRVTTHVRLTLPKHRDSKPTEASPANVSIIDGLCILPKTHQPGPAPLHRLRLPLQVPLP